MPLRSIDDVVADVDAPFLDQRDQVGERRRVDRVRRIQHEQDLAALVQIRAERVDFRREIVALGPATTITRGIVRHRRGCCASTSFAMEKFSLPSASLMTL